MGCMLPVVWNSTKLSGAGKWLDVKNLMCWLQREDETAGQVLISSGYQWSEIPFLWRSFCRSLEGALVQILRTIIRIKQTNKQTDKRTKITTISYQSEWTQCFLISLGFITKIFGLSEFALIGNWTVLALHGHKVTANDDFILWITLNFFHSQQEVSSCPKYR